jgi:hypothetical protein
MNLIAALIVAGLLLLLALAIAEFRFRHAMRRFDGTYAEWRKLHGFKDP